MDFARGRKWPRVFFVDDGHLCMSNNAAERELRAVAMGHKNWTVAGPVEGGKRALLRSTR
jgi:Transposase IS66 family